MSLVTLNKLVSKVLHFLLILSPLGLSHLNGSLTHILTRGTMVF
jgi:hypothetical protein